MKITRRLKGYNRQISAFRNFVMQQSQTIRPCLPNTECLSNSHCLFLLLSNKSVNKKPTIKIVIVDKTIIK